MLSGAFFSHYVRADSALPSMRLSEIAIHNERQQAPTLQSPAKANEERNILVKFMKKLKDSRKGAGKNVYRKLRINRSIERSLHQNNQVGNVTCRVPIANVRKANIPAAHVKLSQNLIITSIWKNQRLPSTEESSVSRIIEPVSEIPAACFATASFTQQEATKTCDDRQFL